MIDVANRAGCDVFSVGLCYRDILSRHGPAGMATGITVDPMWFVRMYCAKIIPDGNCQPLWKASCQLVDICKDSRIAAGRRPDVVAAAAVVIACEGLAVEPGRPELQSVLEMAKILEAPVATLRRRRHEMLEQLVAASKALPWSTNDITTKNVCKHLSFILKVPFELLFSHARWKLLDGSLDVLVIFRPPPPPTSSLPFPYSTLLDILSVLAALFATE